jgi:hypothetical protein
LCYTLQLRPAERAEKPLLFFSTLLSSVDAGKVKAWENMELFEY